MNTKPTIRFALLLALTLSPTLRAQTTQPAADIETLITQLSDDQWRVRQDAQDRLVAIGKDVVPRLQQLAKESQDEEVRIRAEAALRQIEENERTGPTLLTLHLKNVPLQTALAEISRQAKTPIATWPPFQHQPDNNPKITLDADRQPFWLVIQQLCKQAGLSPERVGGPQQPITLMQRSDNWSKKPAVHHNGFLIVAESASRNHNVDFATNAVSHNYSMRLRAFIDPKLRVVEGATMVRLEEVVDDKGNSLVLPSANAGHVSTFSSMGSNWIWELHAQLQEVPNLGTRITRFRAVASFVAQTKSDLWEIPDVLTAKSAERPISVGKYVFNGIEKTGEDTYNLKITIHHQPNIVSHQNPLTSFSVIQQNIRLVDADGRPYGNAGGGGGGGPTKLDYSISFHRNTGDNTPKPGAPAKLLWTIPTEIKEIPVPIDLQDLPIP